MKLHSSNYLHLLLFITSLSLLISCIPDNKETDTKTDDEILKQQRIAKEQAAKDKKMLEWRALLAKIDANFDSILIQENALVDARSNIDPELQGRFEFSTLLENKLEKIRSIYEDQDDWIKEYNKFGTSKDAHYLFADDSFREKYNVQQQKFQEHLKEKNDLIEKLASENSDLQQLLQEAQDKLEELEIIELVNSAEDFESVKKYLELYIEQFPFGDKDTIIKVRADQLLLEEMRNITDQNSCREGIKYYEENCLLCYEENLNKLKEDCENKIWQYTLETNTHDAYLSYLKLCVTCKKDEDASDRAEELTPNPTDSCNLAWLSEHREEFEELSDSDVIIERIYALENPPEKVGVKKLLWRRTNLLPYSSRIVLDKKKKWNVDISEYTQQFDCDNNLWKISVKFREYKVKNPVKANYSFEEYCLRYENNSRPAITICD